MYTYQRDRSMCPWLKGSWCFIVVCFVLLCCLWSFNMGVSPHLMLSHGTPCSSQGEKGMSGFLLSWFRDLGLFLEVPHDCHNSLPILSWYSGLHSSQCRGIRLMWDRWGNQGLLELKYDSRGCSRVSRWDQLPLEVRRERRDSFIDEAGELALILS